MKIRSLNYPQKYKYENVNLIITDAYSQSFIDINHISRVTSLAMTDRIERFIRENPDFSNLLPLNERTRRHNVDIQLTWTALNRLTAVVRNFKGVGWQPGRGFRVPNFESWLLNNVNEDTELYGEKPWVIWETTNNYEQSAWPHGKYVESFSPCGSCGVTITENTKNRTSCSQCGTRIHGNEDCGPWLELYNSTHPFSSTVCVPCHDQATGEEYGGYNMFRSSFSQKVAEKITDEDIRQTLTFIEETFNTFEWR